MQPADDLSALDSVFPATLSYGSSVFVTERINRVVMVPTTVSCEDFGFSGDENADFRSFGMNKLLQGL